MHYFAIGLLSACIILLQFAELPQLAWLYSVLLAVLVIVSSYTYFYSARAHPPRNYATRVQKSAQSSFQTSPKKNAQVGPKPVFWSAKLIDCGIRVSIGLGLGFSWALYSAHSDFSDRLPLSLEGVDLVVTGHVAGIPQRSANFTRFEFVIQSANYTTPDRATVPQFQANRRLRLTWYRNAPLLQSGSNWLLRVKLKRPNGLMNPAGFDYEGWLFRNGFDAVGYVRTVKNNKLPDRSHVNLRISRAKGFHIDQIRQNLVTVMTQALQSSSSGGLVQALVVGERSGITAQQWQTMRATGTNHLMAISGLHIGLVAGFAYFLLRWFMALAPKLLLYIPAQKVAAIAAIVAAFVYAGLAGFSIPTQRAFIMVSIAMLSLLLQRRFKATQYLSYALVGVLVIDPLAPMDAGFWLSFAAVAVLLLGMSNRLGATGLWWRWGRSQWVVFIGLLPLLVFYFGALSLSAPLANIIAIPWVTFLTVPLSLIAAALLAISESMGSQVLCWAAATLDILWPILEWIQAVIPVYSIVPTAGMWAVIAAVAGSLLMLLPTGIPARWLGVLWIVPLFWPQSHRVSLGEVKVTMLDVGQGLSVVVETSNHVLVYDTGAKFSQRFDSASAVVLPFLRQRNVQRVNTLVLSHNDIDHVGSADSMLAGIEVEQVLSSYQVDVDRAIATRPVRKDCYHGQSWWWDQVKFEVLHPPLSIYAGMNQDNNQSCVIRINANGVRILLTGDIESVVERLLMKSEQTKERLQADILVVPHHGSASSSTQAFIDQVRPRIALVSSGYRNRYGFPKPHVVERYLQRGIEFYTTAQYGAMTFSLGARSVDTESVETKKGQELSIQWDNAVRIDHKRFWYSR